MSVLVLFLITASRRLSGKSAQSAEKTEDVDENADDSIGPVLQVCGLLSLLAVPPLCLLFCCWFLTSMCTEIKSMNQVNVV